MAVRVTTGDDASTEIPSERCLLKCRVLVANRLAMPTNGWKLVLLIPFTIRY